MTNCGNCGCIPCMCRVPGFVTYAGYTLEQALASVGAGWRELIEDLFEVKPANTLVVQVKEKYGGLRFYVSAAPRWYYLLIRGAEGSSYQICEYCGGYGERKTPDGNPHGWIKTVCDECYPEANYKKPAEI